MSRPLNIPLGIMRTTRRDHTRVVSLYIAITFGLVLAIVCFRIPFVPSPTLRMLPDNAVFSAHVVATPGNIRLLDAHLGTMTAMQGSPWTMHDILLHTKREFTMHVDADGQISYALDTLLDETDRLALVSFGYEATPYASGTLIGPQGITFSAQGPRFSFRALSPFFDGNVAVYGAEGTERTGLTLGKDGIRLAGMGIATTGSSTPMVTEGTTVLAQLQIAEGTLELPSLFANILPIPASSQAIATLQKNGGTILLTEDTKGIGYFVSFPPGDLSLEELASLGKDIINRKTLTTQALTTDDGEKFTEIRSDLDAIMTDIRAEEDFTFITLTNTEGFALRLARTPNVLTLANRDISLENGEHAKSSCLYKAHTWFTPRLITDPAATTLNTNRTTHVFIDEFGEIAINSRHIKLCW